MLIYRLQPVGYYADDALERTCACDLHPIARRRGGEAGFMSFLIGAAVDSQWRRTGWREILARRGQPAHRDGRQRGGPEEQARAAVFHRQHSGPRGGPSP